MSNLKRNDHERFTFQKRTISINKFEHINLIIQFNEIVVDRDELFSIEKNQNDLNESDHDN